MQVPTTREQLHPTEFRHPLLGQNQRHPLALRRAGARAYPARRSAERLADHAVLVAVAPLELAPDHRARLALVLDDEDGGLEVVGGGPWDQRTGGWWVG